MFQLCKIHNFNPIKLKVSQRHLLIGYVVTLTKFHEDLAKVKDFQQWYVSRSVQFCFMQSSL